MARRDDKLVPLEPTLENYQYTDPWEHKAGERPSYLPDYGLLGRLLTVPTKAQNVTESGVFAKATDLWLSCELRRAGFGDQETWPRPDRPRVLPRDVDRLINALPQRVQGVENLQFKKEVLQRARDIASVSPAEAEILGRAYQKQVDVCISGWQTGPEVLISTKTQVSSFGKNLANRFEEALGDAANLTARHPLAATGYFFVQRATILTEEPDTFERTKDMVRKLRAEDGGPGYTATGLCLVDWDDQDPDGVVGVRLGDVPGDIGPGQFLRAVVAQVLFATPISYHRRVRELFERRSIPV